MDEISKKDWKLYREKLPDWQEQYMEKLTQEYIQILSSDKLASEKFWELKKKIEKDQKSPGVIARIRRSDMIHQLLGLLYDQAITMDDLSEFSDEVRNTVSHLHELGY